MGIELDGQCLLVRRGRAALNLPPADLDVLAEAMGRRLQAEYLEGAIPWMRQHEPELWAQLGELDEEEGVDALVEYENLFVEGLRHYADFLTESQKTV